MKKVFGHGNYYWLDTTDYDYNKLKTGDKVVCINTKIISHSSFAVFGEIHTIKDIDTERLPFFVDRHRHKDVYVDGNDIYQGTITFIKRYEYTHKTYIQEMQDWMQRFILYRDWLMFQRKEKLKNILK